ncbi:hypothetical protein LINPERHAP1_LOCUS29456 [Linum perenne]
MGICYMTRAEIHGIIKGMKTAWNLGIRKLVIQTDSRCAVQIL